MINIEQLQQRRKAQVDAVLASAGTVSKGVQEIVAAYAGYSRKSFEEGSSYVEKLAAAKPLDKAGDVQIEYAKSAWQLLVTEMAEISGLYKALVRETC